MLCIIPIVEYYLCMVDGSVHACADGASLVVVEVTFGKGECTVILFSVCVIDWCLYACSNITACTIMCEIAIGHIQFTVSMTVNCSFVIMELYVLQCQCDILCAWAFDAESIICAVADNCPSIIRHVCNDFHVSFDWDVLISIVIGCG